MKPHPIKVLVNARGRSEASGCSRGCVVVKAVKGQRNRPPTRVGVTGRVSTRRGVFLLGGGHRRALFGGDSPFQQTTNGVHIRISHESTPTGELSIRSLRPRVLRTRRVLVEGYGCVKPVRLCHCSCSSSWQTTITTRIVIIVLLSCHINL
ncbi:unnamed protein product [Musa hybrid cultivar]